MTGKKTRTRKKRYSKPCWLPHALLAPVPCCPVPREEAGGKAEVVGAGKAAPAGPHPADSKGGAPEAAPAWLHV